MKRKRTKIVFRILLFLLMLFMLYPVWFLVSGSLMGTEELRDAVAPLLYSTEEGYVSWRFLPGQPELWAYVKVLFDTPEFFVTFWNTVKVTLITVAGQTITALLAAWGLAVYRFWWKKWVALLYTILMMMPFQVLMLPEYYVLQKTHLYDTHWSLILPLIFSPFAVFLLVQNLKSLSGECLEAARLDGASEWKLFWKLGVPHAKAGILTVMVLCFIECWSMIEQPQAFLEDKRLTLLSQYLPEISYEQIGSGLAEAVLAVIPCILLILLGAEYFERGLLAGQEEE